MIGQPKWLTNRAVVFFFISFGLCSVLWMQYAVAWRFAVLSSLSVLLFFLGGESFLRSYAYASPKRFVRQVFWLALLIRLAWVLYAYFVYNPEYYGNPYGDGADVDWYMPVAKAGVEAIKEGNFHLYDLWSTTWGAAFDDMGYPFLLMLEYLVVGDWSDVFVPFVLKALMSAYTVVCMYHIGQRHFGEDVARLTAVFTAFFPHLIYWCGTMFKEAEMVFLVILFVDKMDEVLSLQNITFVRVLPASLIGMTLFGFRSALGLDAFAAVMAAIVMTSSRIMNTGKKVLAGFLVAFVLFVGMGDSLRQQARSAISSVQSSDQEVNMEWRANRGGKGQKQSFARYAGAAVFAPLIFTIPFPTYNAALEGQILQPTLAGGNYIKNVLSFFVILMMFVFLFTGEWRKHMFILSFTLGYLVILTFSSFAHSGRFHMPIMPMLMLFAACGIKEVHNSIRYQRWYNLALFVEVGFCVFWNWFKLRGRGMI